MRQRIWKIIQQYNRFWLTAGLCAALLLSSCTPGAVLHEAGDPGYIPTIASPVKVSGLSADAYFVYDCGEESFVSLKGAEERIYPASTTKLLTALYALTVLAPDDLVTPGEELSMVQAGSSIAYVKSNHTLTVEMLVQGMMIPSGNDAAYALAAAGGNRLNQSLSGKAAVERFVQGMNEYAKTLGCCSSKFTTPDGLAGEEQYSSIEDMAIIARAAFENELIARYCGQASAEVTYESGHTNTWVNTNALIDEQSDYFDSRVRMGKTGSLDGCYNVIFLAENEGTQYIIGIFGSNGKESRFADGITVMDSVFG